MARLRKLPPVAMRAVPATAKMVQKISRLRGHRLSVRQYQKMMRMGMRYSRMVAVGALLALMEAK